jgi:serine/threonine protein kinase
MHDSNSDLLEVLGSDFQIIVLLGVGSYGSVYKARERSTGTIMAIKVIKPDSGKGQVHRSAIAEVDTLDALQADCPHICGRVYHPIAFGGRRGFILFLKYYDFDLRGIIESAPRGLSPPQVKCYARQLLAGVAFCRSRNILH